MVIVKSDHVPVVAREFETVDQRRQMRDERTSNGNRRRNFFAKGKKGNSPEEQQSRFRRIGSENGERGLQRTLNDRILLRSDGSRQLDAPLQEETRDALDILQFVDLLRRPLARRFV